MIYQEPITARTELDDWHACAIADLKHMGRIDPFDAKLIPAPLHARITDLLAACKTSFDVDVVFQSVQDRQLV